MDFFEKKMTTILGFIGIVSATAYFLGYFYLTSYFSKLGTLVPVSSISVTETTLLGFALIFIGGATVGGALCLSIFVFRLRTFFQESSLFLTTIFPACVFIFVLVFSLFATEYFVKNALPYNVVINPFARAPIVEIIYKNPLKIDRIPFFSKKKECEE